MSYKTIKYLALYYMLFLWNNNYLFIGMNNEFYQNPYQNSLQYNGNFYQNSLQYDDNPYQNPLQYNDNPYQNPLQYNENFYQNSLQYNGNFYQNSLQYNDNPYQNSYQDYQNPNYNQGLNSSLNVDRQQNFNFYNNNLTTNIFESNVHQNNLFNTFNNQLINNQPIINNNELYLQNNPLIEQNITKIITTTTTKNNKRMIKFEDKQKKQKSKELSTLTKKNNNSLKKKTRRVQKSKDHPILTPTKNEIDKKTSYCLLLKEYRLELEVIKNDKLMFKIVIFDTNNTVIIEKSYENIYFYLIWMVIVDCELLKKHSNVFKIIDDKRTYKDFFINKNFIEVLTEKFLEEFRPLIPYLKFNYVSLDQVNNFFINYDKSIEYNKQLQNVIIDIIEKFKNKLPTETKKIIYIFDKKKIIIGKATKSFFIEINHKKKKISNCYLFELINIMIIFYQESLAKNQKINLHRIISIYYNYIKSPKEDALTKQNLIVGILKSIDRKNFTIYFPNIIIDESIELSSVLSLNNQQLHIIINNNNTLQILSINSYNHIFCYYYYNGIKYSVDKKYFPFLSNLIVMYNIYKDNIIFNKLILNTTKKEMSSIYDFLRYNASLFSFVSSYSKNSQIKKKNNNNNIMKIK